jgi:O-methyltransferase domain/Dimerisation domain
MQYHLAKFHLFRGCLQINSTRKARTCDVMSEQYLRQLDGFSSWKMTRLIWGVIPAQAISVAANLGIADLVADESKTAEDLAQATQTDAAALRRLLRALTSLAIFTEDAAGRFLNTALSETLRRDHPDSVRALAILWGTPFFWKPWGEFGAAVATGQPVFDRVHQEPFFDYLTHHPTAASVFNAAMTAVSSVDLTAVLAGYDFSRLGQLVDVGGGEGALLHGILSAYPHLRGILYDLPAVVAGATALRTGAIGARCEVLGGNFFETIPSGADGYILKRVIHDWDDETALKILANCRRAIDQEGTLLLVEWALKPPNEPDLGKFTDLNMLVLLGGRERSEADFRVLLWEAGFALARVISTVGPHSIIESKPQ